MTGSDHTSPALVGSPGSKPQELGGQLQQKDCDQLSEVSSSPSPSSSLKKKKVISTSSEKSLCSSSNDSDIVSRSPPSDLQNYSDCTKDNPKEESKSLVGGIPSLMSNRTAASSSVGHPKMKRTISNCNVRTSHNASTLCSRESSYVYHCPSKLARRNGQKQQQHPHRLAEASSTPSSLVVASTATNFHLSLYEDTNSDETQSMVELIGHRPFGMRSRDGLSITGGSIRRVRGRENGHTSMQATQHAAGQTQSKERDHLQRSSHQSHEKQLISRRQLDLPHLQASSHIALERIHSTGGKVHPQVPEVQHQQLLLRSHSQQPPHSHSHQPPHNHSTAHQQTRYHPLSHQYQMMRSHLDLSHKGPNGASKPRQQQMHSSVIRACHMNREITRVSSAQMPRHTGPSASSRKVVLHIPSGRKNESLV